MKESEVNKKQEETQKELQKLSKKPIPEKIQQDIKKKQCHTGKPFNK